MIVLGLTGSIGMGKSTAAKMLRTMKVPVHDSDAAVHKALRAGGAGVVPVGTAFPESYDKNTKAIDRRALRKLLGADHQKWDELEELLHPLVREEQQEFIKAHQRLGVDMVALDVPLLFETGGEERVDYTICVTAPAFMQRQRVLSRPHVTEEDFAFRMARQLPDADKQMRADYVVQTGIGYAHSFKSLQEIVAGIKSKHGLANEKNVTRDTNAT